MADEKLPLAEKHARDANLWAIVIIAFAFISAAAGFLARISSPAGTPRGGIESASLRP